MQPLKMGIACGNACFTAFIEKDTDGYFVAEVPALKSCYTQARTIEELVPWIREVIELCLEKEYTA